MSPILLVDLSDDILLQILLILNPRDIISIRKTCRTFLGLSQARILWIHAADLICERNLLFRPACPMEELDTSSLEAIATGPTRWKKLMRSQNTPTPVNIRKITMSTMLRFPPYFNFLVPGGRFLLLWGGKLPHLVILDLNGVSPETPLATLSSTRDARIMCYPSPDQQTLCIFMAARRTRGHIEIYEISPYKPNCTFTQIATYDPVLDTAGKKSYVAGMSYQTIAFQDFSEPIIRLWKFRTDSWIASRVDCPPIYDTILSEDYIIFIHRDSFSICDAPGGDYVSRWDAFQNQPTAYISSTYLIRFERPSSGSQAYRPDVEDWYKGSRYHPVLVGALSQTASFTSLNLYRIGSNKLLQEISTAQSLSYWATMEFESPSSYRRSRPCDNGFYRTTYDSNGYLTCQGIIGNDDGSLETVQQTVNIRSFIPDLIPDLGLRATSICPASGRGCLTYYRPQRGPSCQFTIYVIDFLDPPCTPGPSVTGHS